MAVDIKLQPDIKGYYAKTANNFRIIRDLLWAKHNTAGEEVHIVINLSQGIGDTVRLEALAPVIFPVSSR